MFGGHCKCNACLSAASSRPARWSLCGGCGGQVACLAWPHSPACGITLPAPHIPPARRHLQSSLAALTGFPISLGWLYRLLCPARLPSSSSAYPDRSHWTLWPIAIWTPEWAAVDLAWIFWPHVCIIQRQM